MAVIEEAETLDRPALHDSLVKAAQQRGLIGPKDRTMAGRFPDALITEAKRVTGITENTDLLTYALMKVALEDNFGDKLLARKGLVPKGTFFAD